MLVLSRDRDTVVRIGADIKVKVLSIRKQRVKLGIDAPSDVRVWREEASAEPLQSHLTLKSNANGRAAGSRFPVLVVEDDPDHAWLINRVLWECQLPQVTIARTGAAAIETLDLDGSSPGAAVQPHLVLLDLNLPDISGLEVLRRIRSNDRLQIVPVVVLSGLRQESVVADCLQAGANAFVNKSAHYREFRDSLCRIVTFWKSDCRVPASGVELPV